jgi:acetyltransferase-like isoleucine patch superfamily enzyme
MPTNKHDYLTGENFGWPKSVRVHKWANIVGDAVKVGEHSRIDAFVTLTGRVTLGARVHVSTGASIFGGAEGITIGDGCSVSVGVKIFTTSDDVHCDMLAGPQLAEHYGKSGAVAMGAFSVLGAGAVVLPGVVIGDEAQIGANAVIRCNIPENQVWAGVPAHYLCPRAKLDRAKMMGYEAMPNTGA